MPQELPPAVDDTAHSAANAEGKKRSSKDHSLNFRDLLILIADPNAYSRKIIHGMLRNFGANKLLETADSSQLFATLAGQKIDLLICHRDLTPNDGLTVSRAIRSKKDNQNRTIPILITAAYPNQTTVKLARDAGANLVVALPTSPKALYDRLGWMALTPRKFVDTPTYFGPDRRFKIEGYPNGIGRRKGDKPIEVGQEAGPALAQNDIDNLFAAARGGET